MAPERMPDPAAQAVQQKQSLTVAEKNRNIRQRLGERYPEPGITAEEGWKSMETLLGTKMPATPKPPFPLLSLVAAITGLVGLAIFIIVKSSSVALLQNTGRYPATKNTNPPAKAVKPGFDTRKKEAEPASESTSVPASAPEHMRVSESPSLQKPTPVQENRPGNDSHLHRSTTDRQSFTFREENQIHTPNSPAAMKETPGISEENDRISDVTSEKPLLRTPIKNLIIRKLKSPDVRVPIPKFPDLPEKQDISKADTTAKPLFNWGLQWAANFPLSGRKTYAEDLKEQHGAYILAIPGIWLSRTFTNRHDLVISIRPYFDYYSKNELFYQNSPLDNPSDTVTPPASRAYPEARLLKLRSSSITAEYHYRLTGSFLVGGELSYHHHWNALTNIRRLSGSGFSPAADSLKWLGRTDDFWKYLRSNNITAGLNLTYHTSSISLGGSITMPLLPTADNPYGGSKPLNSRIFIRWQLNHPKKNR